MRQMGPLPQIDRSSEPGSTVTGVEPPRPEAPVSPHRARDRAIGLHRTRADAYRVYAILLIIWAHCEMSLGHPNNAYILIGVGLNVIAHAAVPFFVFMAGNQLGPRVVKRRAVSTVRPYLGRLLRLFLVWSAIYFVHGALASERSPSLATFGRYARFLLGDPAGLVLHGTSLHLWFLVALAFSTMVCTMVLRHARLGSLLIFAAVLYGLALVTGPYGALLDPTHVAWRHEAGFLQAPLFFALGIVLSRRQMLSNQTGWTLIAVGVVVQSIETLIFARAGFNPFTLGMLIGTVPLAAGVCVLALQPTATWLERRVAPLSALVPVVYLSHVIFLDLLRPQRSGLDPTLFRIVLPVGVAIAAFGAAWLLSRLGRRWRGLSRVASGGRFGAFA
jgi:surface polysaccharide O-acyltransferase-like enzyme